MAFCLPIERHGGEIENRRRNRNDGHEIVDGTVGLAEVPTPITHGDVIEAAVQYSH